MFEDGRNNVDVAAGSYYHQQMGKIPAILKSFNKNPGFGDQLSELLPSDQVESSDAVAAFLLFVCERQTIWSNKRKKNKVTKV